ncbi:MAG: hypothetical protein KC535_04630 [Nanoarchaeota archaeon]|nr:hypothetical protein [Nanoarchaeota archaeon]
MSEDRVIIDEKKITYSGLIAIGGFYKAMKQELDDLGYGPYEDYHAEEVHEDGKQILITFRGDKKVSDFAKIVWESKVAISQATEVTVQKGHQKTKMHKASAEVKSIVVLSTDYDKSFEQNAWLYFLRVVIDKFVFKSYVSRAMSQAKKDYSLFESKIKSFLNLENFR